MDEPKSLVGVSATCSLHCFGTVAWVTGRTHSPNGSLPKQAEEENQGGNGLNQIQTGKWPSNEGRCCCLLHKRRFRSRKDNVPVSHRSFVWSFCLVFESGRLVANALMLCRGFAGRRVLLALLCVSFIFITCWSESFHLWTSQRWHSSWAWRAASSCRTLEITYKNFTLVWVSLQKK